ncbi:hypothetical protein [Anaeromyxobacter oryzae]|uniref:Uncharacterized protein n=1 Tax=Anaeromyxobacter oryzae TaxID=2918170 RepID=A0ABM7X242_9BACT|nr:hypothetical protein [Anaeromyxobacter oryzae]BDG05860.1 hypothetical protein AMOR_48560 [Anaeromyxobacter oryzae]
MDTELREELFVCALEARSRRLVAHVRAWDADEALELFVAELTADGVDEPGEVAVAPLHGAAACTARFRPPRRR